MSRQRCIRSAHYASKIRFLFGDELHRPSVNVQCYLLSLTTFANIVVVISNPTNGTMLCKPLIYSEREIGYRHPIRISRIGRVIIFWCDIEIIKYVFLCFFVTQVFEFITPIVKLQEIALGVAPYFIYCCHLYTLCNIYCLWALQGLNLRPSSYELAAAYHLS